MAGPPIPTRPGDLVATRRDAVVEFVVLLGFWLVLSEQRSALLLSLGALSAGVVTLLTYRIVGTVLRSVGAGGPGRLRRFGWFLVYVGWMLVRIVAASVQVAYFALNPRLPFEPTFVLFHTQMQRPLSRVVLAVSITLVPGTITVHLEEDEVLVHAAIPSAMDELIDARMQNMIGRFLGEDPEPPPRLEWLPVEEPT